MQGMWSKSVKQSVPVPAQIENATDGPVGQDFLHIQKNDSDVLKDTLVSLRTASLLIPFCEKICV